MPTSSAVSLINRRDQRVMLQRWKDGEDTVPWTALTGQTSSNERIASIQAVNKLFEGLRKDEMNDYPVVEPMQSGTSEQKLQKDSENYLRGDPESQRTSSQALAREDIKPEAIAHGRRMDFEEEIYDTRDHEEIVRSLYHPWITAIWYWLMTVLDPPPVGAYRVTYTCGCGKLCYIDVEELVPGGAEELEQDIRKEASLVRCHNPNSGTSSNNNIQSPAPAHFNASTLPQTGGQGAPIQSLPTLGAQLPTSNIANATAQTPAFNVATTGQKYLLLCVNTKHGLVKLVNMDVSILTNDQFMFKEIRNEYQNARQGHDWTIVTLLPNMNNFPRPILTLISMLSFPNLRLPQWIPNTLQDCKLFVPRKVDFIKFELMPVRLEIYAGNIEKPEIPSIDEVLVKKTYEFEPITLKAKILNVPIHELLKPGQHLNRYWWKRFPKKLDSPLTFDENLDCHGWGILITEGLNRPFVLFLCLLAMIVFVIFVALYSVFFNDGSTGAGIGSFMMAILTLYCTLKYEQWKEQ